MCMIDYADEPCLVLQKKHRVSRVERRCHECSRIVKRGELYLHEVIKFDNDVSSHNVCPQCLVVRYWLMKECSGWVYGGLAEDMVEHAQEGRLYPFPHWMSIARMAVGIRNGWGNGKMPRLALISAD